MKRSILFIINPISGTTQKDGLPDLIHKVLPQEQWHTEVVLTERPGHATEIAAEAARRHTDIVVAVGGDGTINEVGRALVHTETALAVLPTGSGNGLARHLLLPLEAEECLRVIAMADIKDLDYGTIDGHHFFCTCGMGFDAFVSDRFAKAGKRGPITYAQTILESGLKYQPQTYEVTDDTGTLRYRAFLISVANASQYGNGCYIAPQASMSDGLLDVVVMEPFTLMDAPQISIDLFNKTLDKSSRIKTFTTRSLHVKREGEGVIHYDGEPAMAGREVQIDLHAKGIRMVINPLADPQRRMPNRFQSAAAELLHDLGTIREDIAHKTQRGLRYTRMLQRRLTK